jgi:tetratricopeptide (TPR) repeat protein
MSRNPLPFDESLWRLAVEAVSDRIARQPTTGAGLWHQRARWQARLGQQSAAVADLTRALQLNVNLVLGAEDTPILTWRGEQTAQRGEWEKASADFARAVALPDAAPEVLRLHALVRLRLGDADGYRKACTTAVKRLGQTDDPAAVDVLLRCCALGPDAVPDLSALVARAEKNLAKPPTGRQLSTLGAMLFRAGQSEQAAQRLTEAGAAGSAADWLFLAMAHHQLGHLDEAKRWLAKAGQWLEQAPKTTTPPSWFALLEAQLLKGEADKLMRGGM